MDDILREELAFAGFPAFLKDAAVFAGKVSSGDNLVEHEPLTAAKNIGNRSMFITQSEEDLHQNPSQLLPLRGRYGQRSGRRTRRMLVCPVVRCARGRGRAWHPLSATLMLTQPDAYRDHLVGFLNKA